MKISVEKVSTSQIGQVDFDNLDFGKYHTDHMFISEYADGEWKNPRVVPYANLSLSPATAALHYGQSVFEGFKSHRNDAGEVAIFRPDAHLERLNKSLERQCMPSISKDLFFSALDTLTQTELAWVPEKPGCALYYRPLVFAADPFIRVKPSLTYYFLIICSPVGSYYGGAVKVKVEREFVRAAEGGVGFSKTAGNYAASLYPAKKALEQGYHQLLWTDAREHAYIEEAGTMNVMFVVDGKVVTPSLSSSILSGVTRNSIIRIAREWGIEVEERKIKVDELISAALNGTLQEAFGVGTAATISPIELIACDGKEYAVPVGVENSFSTRIANYLSDYKYGKTPDVFQWLHTVKG